MSKGASGKAGAAWALDIGILGNDKFHECQYLLAFMKLSRWKTVFLGNFSMKIYLDSCCFNRPFDDQSQLQVHREAQAKLRIQAGIKAGKYELVWSYALDYENSLHPNEEHRDAIALWSKIATCHVEQQSEQIDACASTLIVLGLKQYDALHIACAVESGCRYFITTDKKILNKIVPDIKLINPIQFIGEQEILQ